MPPQCTHVTTMLMADELRLLNFLAEEYYSGKGAIVDGGCFLGGSTVALAGGLRRKLQRQGKPERKIIHSYDLFQVEDWTRGIYFPETTPAGESFRHLFDDNTVAYTPLISVHPGDIATHPWAGGPIEILFIDVAKHWTVCDWVTHQFFRHLIPGRSVVVQQDYLYHHCVAWLHVTMEYYSDYFEILCDTGFNSVAFLLKKRIPDAVLKPDTVASLSTADKTVLMDRAAARFGGLQHDTMLSAKADFLRMLEVASA